MDWNSLYATRMGKVVASDIRERMKLLAARQIIQLGGGLPDPSLFPAAEIAAATAAIFADPARATTALHYAPSEGHMPLREWIAGYMTSIGAPCGVDNIMITNGSQQAIDFCGRLFLSPGDTVAVEMPSFIGALRAFDTYEPRYVALPNEAEAPLPVGAKFGYLGSDFRNPTGTAMTLAEREAMIDKAAAIGLPLVEDGCYEKLRFEGQAVPSVFALAVQKAGDVEKVGVLHTGTLSKTIAPSLRVGWVAGPSAVIRKLVLIKQAADLATSALNQMIALAVAQTSLDRLADAGRALYLRRRDAMLEALETHMPPGVTWTRPEGGLYIWVTLPAHIDGAVLSERLLMEEAVSVISGAAFYPVDPVRNTVRLSYSLATEEAAREGVKRMGTMLSAMLETAVAAE
ncbi:MAG: PLP-dependent aminotransferase family protein [Caulobacter sp.]|nr:PLP-dependent aminotransferase family protein [Caulobacter sp.]